MTERSSAWHIAYDIRPGKQIERRLVLDSLQAAQRVLPDLESLPYIGMGGFRFVDFLLANRLLGTQSFVSLEHDDDLVARCEFNKPFNALRVFSGNSNEYVEKVGFPSPAIIWFDYESGVSADLKDDMLALCGAVKPGSFVFITATAELPRVFGKVKGLPKRLVALKAAVSPFADKLSEDNVEPKDFPKAAARILTGALVFGFAGRTDGIFYPYLRLIYKDSTWMMTVGGLFSDQGDVSSLKREISKARPFLRPNSLPFIYQVEQFNVTDAERRLLDRMSLSVEGRRSEKMQLKKLGLRKSIIDQYPELMRFIPRYFESLI